MKTAFLIIVIIGALLVAVVGIGTMIGGKGSKEQQKLMEYHENKETE